ncbi:MAG: XRE family transcriptional regulator [Brevundimonas sp.]|nr:MAG: XRE family transcriptional regulator [Brevundimonas sp.]
MNMVEPAQIRMARAALNMSVRSLAEQSGVAESTIHRFETNRGGMHTTTLRKLQSTLESAGIVFLAAGDGGGLGVRLSRPV